MDKNMNENKNVVVVVDDNRITTKLLTRYLEDGGYNVVVAYDGIDCLEKIQCIEPENIICVLTDTMMPRLDGLDMTEKIRADEKYKDISIVIVPNINSLLMQTNAIRSGADEILVKPIEEVLLLAKIKIFANLAELRQENRRLQDLINKLKNQKEA